MAKEKVRGDTTLPMPTDDSEETFPEEKRRKKKKAARQVEERSEDGREEVEEKERLPSSFTQGEDAGFTTTEVDEFIEHARKSAAAWQGRDRADRPSYSQSWHEEVQQLISRFYTDHGGEPSYKHVGRLMVDLLNVLGELVPCRPMSKGRKSQLFPLPIPEDSPGTADELALHQGAVRALNSLHGCGGPASTSAASSRAQKRLSQRALQSPLLNETLMVEDWDDFFLHRGLDYLGDEVKVAKSVTWEGIQASLPAQVGSLDIREFTEGGVRFQDYLLPPEVQWLGKTPRTMVDDSEWPKVVRGLLECKLCTVVPKSRVYHVGDKPLLNGLFAVSKNEYEGQVELLRLIMNLKPLSQNTRSLEGDTATLSGYHRP